MFNLFLNIAKQSVQYVLSYWTSQVNYTVFIKLILDFDQEWKHNPQWDQLLLLGQLLFLTLHRWGENTTNKLIRYSDFTERERQLNADELLKFLESYLWFCSDFSMVVLGLMLTLNRLLTSYVAMGGLLQWMDVCYRCSAGICFPPSGTERCSACLGSVKFHSSLPKRWGIWTWWGQVETWDTISLFFFFSFSSNQW